MIRIFVKVCSVKNGGRYCGLSSRSTKRQSARNQGYAHERNNCLFGTNTIDSRRRADTPNARRLFARRMKWDCSLTVVGTINGTIPQPVADVSCVRTVFSATG